MEKILIEPEARFTLERLCDSFHPQEIGGFLLGEKIEGDSVIKRIFPVPNVSEKPRTNHYKKHSWGDHWSQMYSKTVNIEQLGDFHNHPNGTIPSTQDMRACPGLHLWVIHHQMGQHTFRASRDYQDREVLLLNEVREMTKPHFEGDLFHLGTIFVNSIGQLNINPYSEKILNLKNETRRIYLIAIQNVELWSKRIDLKNTVEQSGKSRQTVRNHLNICVKNGLLGKSWNGRDYKLAEF